MNFYLFCLPMIWCFILFLYGSASANKSKKFVDFDFSNEILSVKQFSRDDIVVLLSNGTIFLLDSSDFSRIRDSKDLAFSTLNSIYVHIIEYSGILICSNEFSADQCFFLPITNNKTFSKKFFKLKLFDQLYESLIISSNSKNSETDLFYAYTWKTDGNLHNLNSTIIRRTLDPEIDEFDQAFDGKDIVNATNAKNPSIENVFGFVYDNYAYFLRNVYQKNRSANYPPINERVIKLTRICLGDTKSKNLRSLASLPLSFGAKISLKNHSKASAAFFDAATKKLYVSVNGLSPNNDGYIFVYDMQIMSEAFVRDFNDCYTSPSAWHVAILEPESPPSLCPIYEMFEEMHKPCNFDICSPVSCAYDARYYVESYRSIDGNLIYEFEKSFKIEKFEIFDEFLYATTSDRFLMVNLNESSNQSIMINSKLINSTQKKSIIFNGDQKNFLLTNGTKIKKYSIGCEMFSNCQEISAARRSKKFASCGWCTNSKNENGFGTTKKECMQNSGIFLTEICPPVVECFTPSILNPINSTTVAIYGNYPKGIKDWSLSVCGSDCVVTKSDRNSLVCETKPPFKAMNKDCSAFIEGTINGDKFRIRSVCGYRFDPANSVDEDNMTSFILSDGIPTWAAGLLIFAGLGCCCLIAFVVYRWVCDKDKVRNGENPWYHMIPGRDPGYNHRYGPSPARQMLQPVAPYGSEPYEDLSFLIPNEIKIPWSSINKQELIGAGHFGEVYKAFYRKSDGISNIVAVKTLPVGARNVRQFIEEGIRMEVFDHKNVLSLIGITFGETNLPMIVTPFMANGDLLTYIRNENNHPTVRQLLYLAIDIAEGLNYLHQLKFIHRDLAARNCMLDEAMRVKVADFGLSRDVYETEFYLSIRPDADIPIKWLPPESIERRKFTSKSDMWSFGVTLWELMTRGVEPYAGMSGFQTLEFLKSGRRLEKPSFCPDEIFDIISICWLINPDDRPDCNEICVRLPATIRMLETNSPSYYNMTAPLRPISRDETDL